MLARSPAVACALAVFVSITRRSTPKTSGSQAALAARLRSARAVVGNPRLAPRLDEIIDPVTDVVVEKVGYSAERDTRMAARAPRNCASAAASCWFETSICSSSPFNAGSLKASHHLPPCISSLGSPRFHPGASLNSGGSCSLNDAAAGVLGLTYFGPT